ncbi:hypothetical protein QA601_06060 [Chitinispirillales bacterium ANBcel5]|uniref:hypothetical protein n=1 Tax=Cellulosispirillum alkaliphilum TaxID=3039283 RepID=UPI002A5018D7|nr:hypothetical protein [Chitinispirillales bacterium ANBcel5]
MLQEKEKRQQLLNFLDNRAFDPILEAIPEHYSSDKDRKMLEDVQEITRYEKDMFHFQLTTAQQIKDQFIREMTRDNSGRISRELEDLELPRFQEIKSQFLNLCNELKI